MVIDILDRRTHDSVWSFVYREVWWNSLVMNDCPEVLTPWTDYKQPKLEDLMTWTCRWFWVGLASIWRGMYGTGDNLNELRCVGYDLEWMMKEMGVKCLWIGKVVQRGWELCREPEQIGNIQAERKVGSWRYYEGMSVRIAWEERLLGHARRRRDSWLLTGEVSEDSSRSEFVFTIWERGLVLRRAGAGEGEQQAHDKQWKIVGQMRLQFEKSRDGGPQQLWFSKRGRGGDRLETARVKGK